MPSAGGVHHGSGILSGGASRADDAGGRLLARYLKGDVEAFAQLVALFQDRLYGFLARSIGDRHAAEDVFQEVFMKVAAKGSGFDRRSSFATWFFAIARNAVLDEHRRRRRDRLSEWAEYGEESDPRPDPGDSPLDRLERKELAARIMKRLEKLPDEQREAFLLKEEADLTFQEIGDLLGCGKETAKSRFRLAVEKLREGLAPGRAR